MSQDTSSSVPESKYPPLQKPDFKPTIPEFLTENVSEQDRFILEQLSILSQYAKWSVDTQMEVHSQVRATNGRLLKVEAENKVSNEDIDTLKTQAASVSPFLKALSYFAFLWEIKAFRWIFMSGIAAIILLVYPYYLSSSWPVLKAIITSILGM